VKQVTIDLFSAILSKLTERTSVASYLVLVLAAFGIRDQVVSLQIAGLIAGIAGVVLFVIKDATVQRLLVQSKPAPVAEQPEVKPMSLLSTIAGDLSKVSPVVSAVVNGITLVEAIAPSLPGAQKLQSVIANVNAAVGQVDGITQVIEGVLAQLKSIGVVSSSSNQVAQPQPTTTVGQ